MGGPGKVGQAAPAVPRVFLSYRRQDAAFQADLLYGELVKAFGREQVFKDVDSIEPGDDFAEAIGRAVSSCTVLLAVIGDRWLVTTDGAGRRRLDDPDDFVRLEIESALRAGVRVVPVLLGAELPAVDQLPPTLAPLLGRQAVPLSPQGFADGVQRLVERLTQLGHPDEPPLEVPTAYQLQIADIAPPVLRGRDVELAQLAAFCAGDRAYGWWQAEAWAGKTALTAWFALHPPRGTEIAAFFIAAGLAGQCDGDAFLEAMAEQLTALAGRPPGAPATSAVRRGRLLELLGAAAERCRSADRRLVLLIDGLDEDTGPMTGKQSIASLLPRRPPDGLRIVVTSRVDRELPRDVPLDHPLRGCRPDRITASAEAHDVELFAKRELATQLGDGALQEDLLGLIAASGGGLSRDDLAQLTGGPADVVHTLLRGRLGRCVQGRRQRLAGSAGGADGGRVYLFAHDTLRQLAEHEFGPRLAGFRDRLHAWAAEHRDRGWPAQTSPYLLRDYPRMLAMTGAAGRLAGLATDGRRHERMLELTGGDALALDETALAQAAVLAQQPPDLVRATALTLRRVELTRRNMIVPVGLAAVWAALGDIARAESLAGGAVGAGRRAEALAEVALAAASIGRLADAETLLDRIPDEDRRDRARAGVMAEAVRIDQAHAERLAARLRHPELRASAELAVAAARAAADPAGASSLLAELGPRASGRARAEHAVALARAGQPAAAEAVVDAAVPGRRGLPPAARARVAAALAAAGAFVAAERVVAGIRAVLIRARALADLIAAVAASGDADTAHRLSAELPQLLPRGDPRVAVDLLLSLGPALAAADLGCPAAELSRLAEELLDGVPGEPEWVIARRLMARAVRGDWSDTPTGLYQLADPDTVARTARELALLAAATGAPERTAGLVAAIPDGRRRAEVLTALARTALAAGQRERAGALARSAERTARTSADGDRLAGAVDQVVDGLIWLGDRAAASALADRIGEPDRRESALGRVAAAEAVAGFVEPARALVERLNPTRRAWGLTDIAQGLADTGRTADAIATADQAQALLE
ncbi:MAG TPA: toll/interleukin-1 receptor domain-containing protein, partial [Pseudonocardia sp.]|nr:toll/interleukin-1 receptor domain-containing protein [Pseudonocardia sp.]